MSTVYLSRGRSMSAPTYLVHDGVMHKFDWLQGYISSEPANINILPNLQEVDLLSVLAYTGGVELGYNVNRVFGKRNPRNSVAAITSILQAKQGLQVLSQRNWSVALNESNVMQYFFVFTKGLLAESDIMNL